jgi:hypothetical protein
VFARRIAAIAEQDAGAEGVLMHTASRPRLRQQLLQVIGGKANAVFGGECLRRGARAAEDADQPPPLEAATARA